MRTHRTLLLALVATVFAVGLTSSAAAEDKATKVMSHKFKLKGEVEGLEEAHMTILAGAVCTGLINGGEKISCLSPDDVQSLAQMKAMQMGTGTCDDDSGECLESLAELTDSEYIVSGTVMTLDDKIRLEATLILVEDDKVVAKSSVSADDAGALLDEAQTLGKTLAGKLTEHRAGEKK